jgi:predicted ATPase with chaperone activity
VSTPWQAPPWSGKPCSTRRVRASPQTAAARLGWSARGFHRLLRIGRTRAELAECGAIDASHSAEATQYRRALGAKP